jgi:hypothetical protein
VSPKKTQSLQSGVWTRKKDQQQQEYDEEKQINVQKKINQNTNNEKREEATNKDKRFESQAMLETTSAMVLKPRQSNNEGSFIDLQGNGKQL